MDWVLKDEQELIKLEESIPERADSKGERGSNEGGGRSNSGSLLNTYYVPDMASMQSHVTLRAPQPHEVGIIIPF